MSRIICGGSAGCRSNQYLDYLKGDNNDEDAARTQVMTLISWLESHLLHIEETIALKEQRAQRQTVVSVKHPPDSVQYDRWRRFLDVYNTILRGYMAVSSVPQHPLLNKDATALVDRRIVGLAYSFCVPRIALNRLPLRPVALQDLLMLYRH